MFKKSFYFSPETTSSLDMPSTHRVSISVQALTPKVNPSSLPALISRLLNLTTPTYQSAYNSQHFWLSNTCSEPKQSSLPETNPLQGESSIFKACPCSQGKNWPTWSQLWHFYSQAQQPPCACHSACHRLSLPPPISTLTTLSADVEPMHKYTETIFTAQCAV